jgi:antitoxin VapB
MSKPLSIPTAPTGVIRKTGTEEMHSPNLKEFEQKQQRIRQFMEENHWEALVIGTQANFSWLSCGGESRVLITGEASDALLVITPDSQTLIAYNMDGQRNIDEEICGLGFDLILTHWNEKLREEIALQLVQGKRTLSDISLNGATCRFAEFYNLHYPLTEWEIERYRALGRESELILKSVVDRLAPGVTERNVERMLMSEFALQGYIPTVVLVGSDERLIKYRHPIPSDKRIEKDLLLVLCNKKYGLHVPITRTVCFGDHVDPETERRYEAAGTIAASCIAHSLPGVKFSEILDMQKKLYAQLGYPDEWRNHFQGGITGYIPNDSTLCFDTGAVMKENQAFNWFITITGVNTEDTYISGKNEIITHSGAWPVKAYSIGDREINLPEIFYK